MSLLSPARLHRLHEVLAGYVERDDVPGLVGLVARGDEVHVEALGHQSFGGEPMRRDTLFRISSMTKPVTAVAAMILVEEGRVRLDDPVDELLPELANRKVLRSLDSELDDTVPANRPITVRDLLTFRLGFGVVLAPPGRYPIQQAIDERELAIGPPKPATPLAPDEWLRRFGELPLLHQPGEKWMYQVGSSLLSVLIERASGQPLDVFFADRIFGPLGMSGTGFVVSEKDLPRFSTAYQPNEQGRLDVYDGVEDSQWTVPPAFRDGGAGLVSTADDYLAFSRMLLGKGKYGGERILSRPSVELMTADHLTPEQADSGRLLLGEGRGWGFGMAVVNRHLNAAKPGQFGWDGGLGTSWAADPAEDLTGVLLTQRSDWPAPWHAKEDFWTAAYAAVDD
ncbi:serine hydrolase domain-containing protein [Amycolatopsis sp. H20-H5]|uniref:serine hydrolase domain-containing protein n=1 Tax=Amycolatopsis sp. H20-H5 TaxID=3046309 RepID=UPI002DBD81ED|nr:serine hydrolase domain-containing protein [Amycolatopsis sp. H20-H5]MEC3973688.1 serine hydrolase domain-containing protein [Amycolatopsis sp. H20-H5]